MGHDAMQWLIHLQNCRCGVQQNTGTTSTHDVAEP